MNCVNCDKLNPKGSIYCQKCGRKLDAEEERVTEDEDQVKTSIEEETLWSKFAELYDSTGKEREKYLDLTSNEAWDLLQRISTNIFESLIEKNKDELNKHPYRLIESLKNNLQCAAAGGYWLWLAEQYYEKKTLAPLKGHNFDKLVEEWKKLAFDDYSTTFKKVSESIKDSMNTYHAHRLNSFLDSLPDAKDLTNDLIEQIKENLIFLIVWSYIFGVAESKYRK